MGFSVRKSIPNNGTIHYSADADAAVDSGTTETGVLVVVVDVAISDTNPSKTS